MIEMMDEAKDAGSPAWAGIDRRNPLRGVGGGRFPRVGGDRPSSDLSMLTGATVPPRGRG